MTRAEEYRRRAKEAEEQANKVRDPSAKEGFLVRLPVNTERWPNEQNGKAGRAPRHLGPRAA
jgi:hypothetical protein